MNEAELQEVAQRERAAQAEKPCRILCCASTPCLSADAGATLQALQSAVDAAGAGDGVAIAPTGCLGLCSRAPVVRVQRQGEADTIYADITPEVAPRLVEAYARPEPEAGVDLAAYVLSQDEPFFTRQHRRILATSGVVDPERIEDAIASGGYQALARAVTEMTPAQVVDEVTHSGLRGRGGAGYATGVKWGLVARAEADQKYVVCNGDEGDPGAYMDRTLMEADPHRVLEGMALAAYAVGATQGFIYVRAEYPVAVKRLEKAIKEAERRGLLGARVLDTHFQFRLDIRVGGGAFVCGEETALMASIEGGRGLPRARPPFPAQSGLWGKPTLINNVETYANIPAIVANGGAWYASLGTEKSRGTKIFALAGKVRNTGLIEVPLGITLRDLVYELGGGMQDDRPFKAVQTGGPSGGCIPAQYLDVSIDYESLAKLGSIVGSGGLIVMDDTSCMVDVARYYMDFCMHESCGKCVPCRAGTVQATRILEAITSGQATLADLDLLEQLCGYMKDASLCGLGQTAPNPVVSTLRYFREEYLAHILERRCPAGVCTVQPPASNGWQSASEPREALV